MYNTFLYTSSKALNNYKYIFIINKGAYMNKLNGEIYLVKYKPFRIRLLII